jgi:hypothetical protein
MENYATFAISLSKQKDTPVFSIQKDAPSLYAVILVPEYELIINSIFMAAVPLRTNPAIK